MKDIFLRYELNLDMCRGQCYAGDSNILEKSFSVPLRFLKNNQRHITHTAMLIRCRFRSKISLKIQRFCKAPWYCRGDSRGDSVLLGFNFFPENIVGLRFM